MYATRHDLPESTRAAVAALLQASLFSALELKLRVKQAHWTVRGAQFAQLHELFDKLAADADGYADDFAERSVALGFPVQGTSGPLAAAARLGTFTPASFDGKDLLAAIRDSLAAFAKELRGAIDAAADAKDAGTSDLFTGASRDVDKWLWMIEAHL